MDNEFKELTRDARKYIAAEDCEDYSCSRPAPIPPPASVPASAPATVRKTDTPAPEPCYSAPAEEIKADQPVVEAKPVLPAETSIPEPKPQSPAITCSVPQQWDKEAEMEKIRQEVSGCQKCQLGLTRLNPAFGVGNLCAKVMFIGEGPGYEEDHRGEPFVGKAGQLLDKILSAMGLSREQVYIANIVKCHPMITPNPNLRGNDRPPYPEEMATCRPYLDRQIAIVKPQFIVALGGVASKALVPGAKSLSSVRGRVIELPNEIFGLREPVKLIATYHPAALLRNPNWKKDTWEDMKLLMREMGLPMPSKQS